MKMLTLLFKYLLALSGCLLIGLSAHSQDDSSGKQDKWVTGKITSINGAPIGGVNIYVDGRMTGRTSNFKGIYRVKVRPGVRTLSAVSDLNGSREVLYNSEDTVNFILNGINSVITADPGKGQEVNNGFENVSRDETTHPVGKAFETGKKKPYYRNIYAMIKGEVPGVAVNGTKITIREGTSLNQSTDPLLVVDGIVVSDISFIAPDIVESIEVLKGTAAAIYGTRGMNGVILIRTRTK